MAATRFGWFDNRQLDQLTTAINLGETEKALGLIDMTCRWTRSPGAGRVAIPARDAVERYFAERFRSDPELAVI